MKEERKSELKVFGVLFVIALLEALVITFFIVSNDNSVSGKCSINNIEYKDVTPNECWNEDINATLCPLPKDIECSGSMEGLGSLLINLMLKE